MDLSKKHALQIVRLLRRKPQSFWQLLSAQDASLRQFIDVLKALLKREKIAFDEQRKVFSLLQDEEKGSSYVQQRCLSCRGRGLLPRGKWRAWLKRYESIVKERPLPRMEYDQGFMLPLDVYGRVAYMNERGDLEGQKVLILGDDDLVSILLGLTSLCQITVLETDERITNFIHRIKRKQKMSIRILHQDIQKPLAKSLQHSYDVFLTDPPESFKGLTMFLKRGIEGLKKESGVGYFGLTHLESSKEKWFALQQWILRRSFVITDILRDFSFYPEKENQWDHFYEHYDMINMLPFDPGNKRVDWFRSSFLRLEYVKKRYHKMRGGGDLYLDQETIATPLS